LFETPIIANSVRDGIVFIDRSRCLRMRFNRSSCSRCISFCPAQAINIGDDLFIQKDKCNSCLLCTSLCPTEALSLDEEKFFQFFASLKEIEKKVSSPVLSCKEKKGKRGHVTLPCVGYLSEERLLSLAFLFDKVIQIDVSSCQSCEKAVVVPFLKELMDKMEEKLSFSFSSRIKIIENEDNLDFEEVPYGRRDFFTAVQRRTFVELANWIKTHRHKDSYAYSIKEVPLKRTLLNRVFARIPREVRKLYLKHYYFSLQVNDDCDHCFACVGACSTGALKIGTHAGKKVLLHQSALCVYCGLCVEFCRRTAIQVEIGFKGVSPFEFELLK